MVACAAELQPRLDAQRRRELAQAGARLDPQQCSAEWRQAIAIAEVPSRHSRRSMSLCWCVHVKQGRSSRWRQAHLFRRPIVVYAEAEFRGQSGAVMQQSTMQGVYLPILYGRTHIALLALLCTLSLLMRCSWPAELRLPEPIAIAHTRGHFSALVPAHPPPSPVCHDPALRCIL